MDRLPNAATGELTELTADIVSAYVSNNAVNSGTLPDIISSVYGALAALLAPPPVPEAERPVPAVPVKKSVTPDYLISLEDGRRYKSLKRHLNGRGLTPDQYRAKWGLPVDYPMAAPNYTLARSDFAKKVGFGTKKARSARAAKKPAAK